MIGHPQLKLWTQYNPDIDIVTGASGTASGVIYTAGTIGQSIVCGVGNSGVTWTDNAVLNFEYTQPLTLICRIATNDSGAGSTLLARYSASNDKGWSYYISNTKIGFVLNNTYPSKRCLADFTTASTTSLRDIAITYDGSGHPSGIKCYVNGSDIGSASATTDTLDHSSIVTTSGAVLNTGLTNYFDHLQATIEHQYLFFSVLPVSDIRRINSGLHPLLRS